jgi:hypothetical protein
LKKIVDYIPQGIERPIPMSELSSRTGQDPRTVRQQIFDARCKGELICSTCDENNGGYYIPRTPDEAKAYLKMTQARIKSACRAVAAVRKFVKAGGATNE